MAYDVEEAKKLVVEAGKKLLETGLIALGVMFLQESAILSLLSHRQAERMIRLHLMRLLLLILMTVHTRVILNRQVKREFTLTHISIIHLLISLFILTKRLRLLSALQVWKLKMYIMNSSLF